MKKQDQSIYGQKFRTLLESIGSSLQNLGQPRRQVDNLQISLEEELKYYTDINQNFLDAIATMASMELNPRMISKFNAYANFLNAKERAGLERAVLAVTFAADAFPKGYYERFVTLYSEQDIYLQRFRFFAGEENRKFFEKNFSDGAVSAVQSYRHIAKEKKGSGSFGVDSTKWFEASTRRIGLLKKIEDRLTGSIVTTADSIKTDTRNAMVSNLTIYSAVVLIIIVFGLLSARTVTKKIRKLDARLDTVVETKDFDKRVEENGDDEITSIQKSVSNHHECRFGKWYENEGKKAFAHTKSYDQITQPHTKVHELMKEIAQKTKQNALTNSEIIINDFKACEQNSQQLFGLLDDMILEKKG